MKRCGWCGGLFGFQTDQSCDLGKVVQLSGQRLVLASWIERLHTRDRVGLFVDHDWRDSLRLSHELRLRAIAWNDLPFPWLVVDAAFG